MLDLSGCLGFKEAGVTALASSIHSLKSLNLCGCTAAVTDKALQVGRHARSLRHTRCKREWRDTGGSRRWLLDALPSRPSTLGGVNASLTREWCPLPSDADAC